MVPTPEVLLLIVLASGSTAAWLVLKEAIAATAMVSTGLWAVIAAGSRDLTRYFQDGTSSTVTEPTIQWLAVGLAILSFVALLLGYWGEYPPEEALEDELDPEGRPSTGEV